ncbi:MAG TPA: hypothetical protein VFV30_08470 [Novosphingobium sp.]|nr:hypothetical protein [Novosphingobium sp.]
MLADDIVVQGQALRPEEAEARALAYVQALGVASSNKPAARWIDPVCPKVTGIADPKIASRVIARIRKIAADIGARVDRAGCRGNLMVAFADDGADLARRIGAANPRLMGQVPTDWRGQLVSGTAPVRWWYSFSIRGADGKPPTTATLPWFSVELDGGNNAIAANVDVGNESGGGYNIATRSSLISTNSKRAITSATVVVDVRQAEGKDLAAITDYAALVGLAEIRFVPSPAPDTVLGLFEPASAPRGLTDQDQALLKSLYSLPLDRQGRYHRGWLVRDIGKSMTAAE